MRPPAWSTSPSNSAARSGVAVLVTVFGSASKHAAAQPGNGADPAAFANRVFVYAADRAFVAGALFLAGALVLVAAAVRVPRPDRPSRPARANRALVIADEDSLLVAADA